MRRRRKRRRRLRTRALISRLMWRGSRLCRPYRRLRQLRPKRWLPRQQRQQRRRRSRRVPQARPLKARPLLAADLPHPQGSQSLLQTTCGRSSSRSAVRTKSHQVSPVTHRAASLALKAQKICVAASDLEKISLKATILSEVYGRIGGDWDPKKLVRALRLRFSWRPCCRSLRLRPQGWTLDRRHPHPTLAGSADRTSGDSPMRARLAALEAKARLGPRFRRPQGRGSSRCYQAAD